MPPSPRPLPTSVNTSASTTPSGRTPHLAVARPTRYTSTSRSSQRHDQPAAVQLSRTRACADKPSHLLHILSGQRREFVVVNLDPLVEPRPFVAKVSQQRAGTGADGRIDG